MTLAHGPSTVFNGLMFCVDPANIRSYPGSGSTIYDLGPTGQQGTNSGTITSTNQGVMTFNGSQRVNFGTSFTNLDASDMTMLAWIYPTSLAQTTIIDKDSDVNQGWGYWMQNNGKQWFWPNSNQDIKDASSLSAPANTWTQVCTTWGFSSKTATFYYNGVLGSSITNASASPGGSSAAIQLAIGQFRNGGGAGFVGNIGPVMLYNRVLSITEIQQNFSSLRYRYGI